MGDVITELRIVGMRSIADARIPLQGLTVLIGENGAGKSTIIEALEVLRRVSSGNFAENFDSIHGGVDALVRAGESGFAIAVTIEGDGPALDYSISILSRGNGYSRIGSEMLSETASGAEPLMVVDRTEAKVSALFGTPDRGWRFDRLDARVDSLTPAIKELGVLAHPAVDRLLNALRRIEVHLPFDTHAAWLQRSLGKPHPMRASSKGGATRLERGGSNLASAFHALKNNFSRAHWDETLEYVRLGFGHEIEDVYTIAEGSDGRVGLWLKRKGLDPKISAVGLSDGQLAYLAFVALVRLNKPGERSLLAFDEPDLHLHPRMLGRVAGFFQEMARQHPVIVATHSRRFLDHLDDPAHSALLCELDPETSTTRFLQPDATELAKWLDEYEGLGAVLDAGYGPAVMREVGTK